MNNRLTLQDLGTLLAEVSGKDRAAAELFLREFVTIVSERVCEDKIVKVKGLGTFRVIPVEERESVHVHTGERFIIPAHYKFSFLPDRELREQVNKPFSFFETTEINENVVFPDMEIAEDAEKKENDDESIEEITPDKTVIVAPPKVIETDEGQVAENKEEKAPQEEIEKEISEKKEKSLEERSLSSEKKELALEPQPVAGPIETVAKNSPVRRKNRLKWMIGGGVIVFLLIAVNVGLYMNKTFFLQPVLSDTEQTDGRPDLLPGDSVPAVASVSTPDTASVAVTDSVAVIEGPVPAAEEISDLLAKVKIEAGSRLTLISLEYYGSKLFWVYIYEHNKSIIKDPNNIPIGTVLEIPAPELYGIDAHSRSSLDKAAARQTEILSGKL